MQSLFIAPASHTLLPSIAAASGLNRITLGFDKTANFAVADKFLSPVAADNRICRTLRVGGIFIRQNLLSNHG